MGIFDNNWNLKLKNALMDRYENPDGFVYYDESSGKFHDSLNQNQRDVIRKYLEGGLTVETVSLIVYPHIPAERMEQIYMRLKEWEVAYLPVHLHGDRHSYRSYGDLTRMDVWKCGQMDLPLEKTDAILFLCYHGGNPFLHIPHPEKVSVEILRALCELAGCKSNACKEYKEGVNEDLLIRAIETKTDKAKRAGRFLEIVERFFE